MKAYLVHIQFEFRNAVRDGSLLLMNYLFPLAVYLVIGGIMVKINPSFQQSLIPSMMMFSILSSFILSLPSPLVTARLTGIFRSYRINGVPAWNILTIPALTSFAHMILVGAIIMVTAGPLFHAPMPVHYGWFILGFILICFACAGYGTLIGVIAKNPSMTILWTQLIFLPSTMIGGIMFPTDLLPGSMKTISSLLPTSWARQLFDISYGTTSPTGSIWPIAILLAGGLLCFIISAFLFSWDSQVHDKRKNSLWALIVLIPYIVGSIWGPIVLKG
jgi:ABC-2 type transport system permease protein